MRVGKKKYRDFLLGEDLAEKDKKIIKSARASDTVMNTPIAPRKWHPSNDYYQRSYASLVRARVSGVLERGLEPLGACPIIGK